MEQSQDCALRTSLTLLQSEGGTKSLRLADNIDLIAGSKAKLTDLTSRLTYQHVYFAGLKQTGHGYHHKWTLCTGDNIGGNALDEMNNIQYNLLQLNEGTTTDVIQETFSYCYRTDNTLPILFPMANVHSESDLLCCIHWPM